MLHPETEADAEFLLGISAIAAELKRLTGQNWTERRAGWLIESGVLPAGMLGGRVCAKRAAIREVLEAASTESAQTRERIAAAKAMTAGLQERAVDALLCAACQRPFERPSRPGRPPKYCPACKATRGM